MFKEHGSMGYMAGVDPFLHELMLILVSFARFSTIIIRIIIIQGEISGPKWRESGAKMKN